MILIQKVDSMDTGEFYLCLNRENRINQPTSIDDAQPACPKVVPCVVYMRTTWVLTFQLHIMISTFCASCLLQFSGLNHFCMLFVLLPIINFNYCHFQEFLRQLFETEYKCMLCWIRNTGAGFV